MEYLVAIVSLLLGNGIIQFLINRHDNLKKENIDEKLKPLESKIDKILDEQKKSEKDNLRTQLLVMMNMMPNNHSEILTLAERYFGDLKGDWFYSSLFARWLKDNDIEKPIWFDK